ncbi:TetR/AcrR family transcriptional regulator [Ensifer adhaerens]|uniref:TetR/AcrR family transcriptional regulator n=1 Tax=Ensifer adhaerens TaxID=106592 RepID=UPI003D046DCE
MEDAKKRKPRTQPPEKRRDDLMNAAEKLFLKNGISGTTIEQISLGADLSKGAFYLHFSSKEEIHLALCERFSRRFNESVHEAISRRAKSDWRGKILAWVRASTTGLLDHGALVNMLFHTSPIALDREWDEHVIAPIFKLLQTGVENGAWHLADCRATAIFLYSGLHGVVDDALMGPGRTNRARLVRGIEETCLATLRLTPE